MAYICIFVTKMILSRSFLHLSLSLTLTHSHSLTHSHTHIYIYIYTYPLCDQHSLEVASNWLSMEDLVVTGVYGVREYHRGATIDWHTDPIETQPFTAVLHVSHSEFDAMTDFEECTDNAHVWAFEMAIFREDLFSGYEAEAIHLRENEAIIFESAKVAHGRTSALPRKWYGNVFVHIAPIWWAEYISGIL